MPHVITIDGIIGIHTDGRDIKNALEEAGGAPVRVEIASPGGIVIDGLEIFNRLRNYPGEVHTHIMSLAASMGSFIALAGDKRTSEKKAVFMIHNVWSIGIGDHRDLRAEADILEGLTSLLADTYAEITGKPLDEIRQLMDDETFFFGDEIKDAGFVQEITEGTDDNGVPAARSAAVSFARASLADCLAKMKERERPKDELQRVAAMLGSIDNAAATVVPFDDNIKLIDRSFDANASETRWRRHAGVESSDDLPNSKYSERFSYVSDSAVLWNRGHHLPIRDFTESDGEFVNISAVRNAKARLSNTQAIPASDKPRVERVLQRYLDKFNAANDGGGKLNQEVKMDREELKREHPALFNALVQEGAEQERDRVVAHLTMAETSGAMDFAVSCIKDGKGLNSQEVMAKYMSAGLTKNEIETRAEENPDDGLSGAGGADEEAAKKALLDDVLSRSNRKGGAVKFEKGV